ncbi:MAG: hypothetical protein PHE32_01910 [Candidatus Shapirobacteria bacterium]|nr:hypothetical protein [Candidatus Shapirobacteria bacterium]MDD4410429.1 hypothetical protein [Candidatus Shapirobacteria bacterium]
MEKTECLPIPNLDTRNRIQFHEKKINSLLEITKFNPFLGQESIVSIIDMDGVLCEYGRRNNLDDNFSRFLGLKKIIERSDEFVVYSSRFEINEDSILWEKLKPIFGQTSIVRCPFMVESSKKRLEDFTKKANENCDFRYLMGLKKMRSCFRMDDDLQNIVEKTLRQDKKLVMVGSSIFDRKIVNKNLNLENVYYFNTGHILV